jgi:hypothetical protein
MFRDARASDVTGISSLQRDIRFLAAERQFGMKRGSLPIQQLASPPNRRGIEFIFLAAHAPMKWVYTWSWLISAATLLWLV